MDRALGLSQEDGPASPRHGHIPPHETFFFFFTHSTGLRRSLSLKLGDTRNSESPSWFSSAHSAARSLLLRRKACTVAKSRKQLWSVTVVQ